MGEGQPLAAPHPKLPQTGLRALAPTSVGAVSDRPTPGIWAKATRKRAASAIGFSVRAGRGDRAPSDASCTFGDKLFRTQNWSPFHGIGRLGAACAPAKCAGGVNARPNT
jgi:hypothetical protein